MSWSKDNFWEAAQNSQNDPDGILKYYLDLVENFFKDSSTLSPSFQAAYNTYLKVPIRQDIINIANLFDADKCPVEILPYLSRLVGWNLYYEEPNFVEPSDPDFVLKKRQQVKSAFELRRTKGPPVSFKVMFDSVGIFSLNLISTWVKVSDITVTQDLPWGVIPSSSNEWVLDSTLKLVFSAEDLQKIPGPNVANLVYRVNEIKPIHLVLYIIAAILFTEFNGQEDVVTISDFLNTVGITIGNDIPGLGTFADLWSWRSANCLTHGGNGYPPRKHNRGAIWSNGDGEDNTMTPYGVPAYVLNTDPLTGSSRTYHSDPFAYLRGYTMFNNRMDILHNHDCKIDFLTITDITNPLTPVVLEEAI